MKNHNVRTYRSAEHLKKEDQLAYKLAQVAVDPVVVVPDVIEMIINRIIDNASVAMASINRQPVVSARGAAISHQPTKNQHGSLVFGGDRATAEWAALANGVAVRELDYHDTFLAAEYSHPGDNIPPILAVGQHMQCSGNDLIRGIATGYEVQIDLARGISLHEHKIDHVAHLGPSAAAGIGTMLNLDREVIFQSIGQALHTTTATRQSRKGKISSWKAFAPAFAGKMAVEAVDRCMRGETSPSPIYEGEDGIIAWLLSGPDHQYVVPLPEPGEPKRAILDSYTKEHSAEYQSQALIDLARKVGQNLHPADIEKLIIHTSHHTHQVIGTGSNDPQKFDPAATRETLDHSIMYIVAVALEDGVWHHVDSYTSQRAQEPHTVDLWNRISTVEDPEWTQKYHDPDPTKRAFGGRFEIFLKNGTVLNEELAVADAHPQGAHPFARKEYVNKFTSLTAGIVPEEEQVRFLEAVQNLPNLRSGELDQLNISLPVGQLKISPTGIFDA